MDTHLIPQTIAELRLFIESSCVAELRYLYSLDELPFSTYEDEYEELERRAFSFDDPILQLLIVKVTSNPEIIEQGFENTQSAIRQAALANKWLINEWDDHLLRPKKLQKNGFLKFFEALKPEERMILLYDNPRFQKTRCLEKLHQLYIDKTTSLDTRRWLASALVTRLPEYEFEGLYTRSYEPPIEDWDRQRIIADVFASILVADEDLLPNLITPFSRVRYPKFDLSTTAKTYSEIISTQDLKFLKNENLASAVKELLTSINVTETFNAEMKLIALLGQRFDEIIKTDNEDDETEENFGEYEKLYCNSALQAASATLLKVGNRYDNGDVIPLLLNAAKMTRLFALRHINFSMLTKPEQLPIVRKIWKLALKIDGRDAMEALVENEYAIGLTKFIHTDGWYRQHDEMTELYSESELTKISEFFTSFFDYDNLDKYESELFYARDASTSRWNEIENKKNPASVSWDNRTLESLSISELIDRLKYLAQEEDFTLKEFALLQAELSKRTLIDENQSDIAAVRLPPDVLTILEKLRNASSLQLWLLTGLIGFWIYVLFVR